MAHGLLATAAFEDIADHIAYIQDNRALLGPTGLPLFTLISALDNADLTANGVEDAARKLDQKLYDAEWYDTVFTDFLNALTRHLLAAAVTDTAKDVYATVDAYLTGESIRVHTAFADVMYQMSGQQTRLTAANVYDESAVLLGTIDWTGTGTGALTDGSRTNAYTGGNSLQWRIPTGKSVTSSSVTLTLELPDGTTEEKTITIVGSAGDTGDIGTHYSDVYVDLDSITINSGGANGNQAIIETVCDRDPALIS